MKVLLDTHSFLWFLLADPRLSGPAHELISDARTTVYISPATYWEIAIKISLGKYALPILPRHTAILTELPFHHRDPFDRLLIAQSTAEELPLVSCDSALDDYGISRLW